MAGHTSRDGKSRCQEEWKIFSVNEKQSIAPNGKDHLIRHPDDNDVKKLVSI